MSKFFIKEKNVEKGPLSLNELYDFIDWSKNYLIWYKGLDNWIPFEKSDIYNELVKKKMIGAKKNRLYQLLSKVSIILFIILVILIAIPYNSFTRVFFQKNLINIYIQILISVIILIGVILFYMWSVFTINSSYIKIDKSPKKKYFYMIPFTLVIIQILYFLIIGFYSETKINSTYSEIQIQNELDYNSILGKRGLKNSKENKVLIPPDYSNITYYNNIINDSSLFIVQKHKQFNISGVVDIKNNQVIPFEAQSIDFLNEKTFIVEKTINGNNKFGIINSNNEIVIPFLYSHLYAFANDVFIVNSGGEYINEKYFVIDINNKKISRNYISIRTFKERKFAILFDMRHSTNGVDYNQGDLYDFENRIIYHKINEDVAEKIIDKQYFKNIRTSNF